MITNPHSTELVASMGFSLTLYAVAITSCGWQHIIPRLDDPTVHYGTTFFARPLMSSAHGLTMRDLLL